MDSFSTEIAYEVRNPKPQNNNLPKKLIEQLKKSGKNVIFYKMKNTNIAARTGNPIEDLYNSNKLSRHQFKIAEKYQKCFLEANKSKHARPSHDGTPISAGSTKKSEPTPSDKMIDADRFIFAARAKLRLACDYKVEWVKGNAKWVSLKLLDILTIVFENETKLRKNKKDPNDVSAEGLLSLDRRTIEERIRKICDVMLDI